MKQTLENILSIINNIEYKDWACRAESLGDGFYIQLGWDGIELEKFSGHTEETLIELTGRKWYISSHATNSEVIQTVFLAVKTAELHEIHENFKYKNKTVFNPHYNIEELVSKDISEDTRHNLTVVK